MEKVYWTGAMFVVVLGCVALAAATKSVLPVFFGWAPLLVLVWRLNRPSASDAAWPDQANSARSTGKAADSSEEA